MLTLEQVIDDFLATENPDVPLHMYKSTIESWKDIVMSSPLQVLGPARVNWDDLNIASGVPLFDIANGVFVFQVLVIPTVAWDGGGGTTGIFGTVSLGDDLAADAFGTFDLWNTLVPSMPFQRSANMTVAGGVLDFSSARINTDGQGVRFAVSIGGDVLTQGEADIYALVVGL